MLSAFKAEPIHELKSRDKAKIESLLGYGDRLLVGLNTGVLRIYIVNNDIPPLLEDPIVASSDQPPQPSTVVKQRIVELLKEEEKFSKKPIQQLARIKEANLLVSLSDGYISLHDLQTFELVERLDRTKGAVCFTVTSHVVKDPETNVPSLVSRLAVGVKRKVLCWTWRDLEMMPEVGEVNMEAAVKSLTWVSGAKLIVGMDPGFSVLDITSQQIAPITKPATRSASDSAPEGELPGVRFAAVSSSGMGYMGMGSWLPKPMATGMSDGQVLLAKDVNTLFVDSDGGPLDKRQIPWSLAPEAIGYSYPYLLALLPPEKGTLHIRNPDTLNLLQSISVPGAAILHNPQHNISLAHAGKGFIVASDRIIWRMNALPYDNQIQELVQKQRFDEAISLLNLLEDTLIEHKNEKIREVSIQKATMLFEMQNYQAALDLFVQVQAPVARVIALYPKAIAGDLSRLATDPESDNDAQSEDDGKATQPAPKDVHATPTKNVLSKFMGGGQAVKDSDTASIRSSARSDLDNQSIRGKPGQLKKTNKIDNKPLEGKDPQFAVLELRPFLVQARRQVQRYMNPDGKLAAPLAFDSETRRPAFANLLTKSVVDAEPKSIDWEDELLKVAQLVDTTLFKAYMLVSPGLAGPLFRVENFCDPVVVQDSLYAHDRYSDLIDFLHGKKLHRQALEMLQKFGKGEATAEIPEGMRGPDSTVAYLKQLTPDLVDLILEFVRWPLSVDVDKGMDVFLADSDNAERLPRDQVLQFLSDIDRKLSTHYLEHIINELNDDEPDHHQHLVDSYLNTIKDSSGSDDLREDVKNKLETFLRKSRIYNKAKTFRQLPTDEPLLYESRAIVLSAMGNHKQALAIYVFQLQSHSKAEEFCNRVHLAQQAETTSTSQSRPSSFRQNSDSVQEKTNIFAALLGLYLQPPAGESKRWPEALDLLSKHGARLPASSTVDLMPDDLPIQQLQDYFRGRIRHTTSLLREEKIVRGLENVRHVNAERHLQLGPDDDDDLGRKKGRNRRVRITEEDHCPVCHKRFGASAVRVYPDNVVVHYGCVGQRAHEVPVKGRAGGRRLSAVAGGSRSFAGVRAGQA